jgi:uncharacterized protein YkwD
MLVDKFTTYGIIQAMKRKRLTKTDKIVLAVSLLVVGFFVYICAKVMYAESGSQPPAQTVREDITAASLYNLVNQERQKAGVTALSFNDKLNESAELKCEDMVAHQYYEHENPKTGERGGKFVFKVLPNATLASENLDQGTMPNSQQVITDWLNSPSHKAAMLDPKWTDTGFATCQPPGQPEGSRTIVQHLAIVKEQQVQPSQAQPQQSTRQSCVSTPQYMYIGLDKHYTGTTTTCR